MNRPSILVLCTGNSARSQMAQAYLSRELAGSIDVYSAGTEPAKEVHPMTLKVLEEAGFDLEDRTPKGFRQFLGHLPVHTLIIVCDGAAKACPAAWPGVMERLFWPFEDPAAAEGSEEEKLQKFREIRDQIEAKVKSYVSQRRKTA